MTKILFALFLAVHGLIHLMGFAKAFRLAEISQLTQEISRPAGAWWLAAGALFLAAALGFALGSRWWWAAAGIAVVISQVLITLAWSDAKFGTLANVIALGAVALAFGSWSFDATTRKELTSVLARASAEERVLTGESLAGLPVPVQRWLRPAVGRPVPRTVRLKQQGSMRTSRDGNWMPFEAQQWFTTETPGFLWQAEVSAGPGISLAGRDTYVDGRGHMVIKLASLFTVADASGAKTDQGTLVRYLAEMCWFPAAAASRFIHWEELDSLSARATMTFNGITGSGVFTFNEQGDMVRFEAKRYYDRGGSSSLETWIVETEPGGVGTFEGVRMPVRSSVTWALDDGPFTWLRLEILELTYNRRDLP